MPAEDETRYTPTDPPTLEQLRAMLESVASARATRNAKGTQTRLIFDIDAVKLHEQGGSCYATAKQIVETLLSTVGRMLYFDEMTKDYVKPNQMGTTAADIQAFVNQELLHVGPGFDLQSNMRRRMFNEILSKMKELAAWRAAVDSEKFSKAAEAERRRREAVEEMRRKAKEANAEHMRRQQEYERRQREKAESERRESRAGADRPFGEKVGPNPFEGVFGADFESAFGLGGKTWREQYQQYYNSFYGDSRQKEEPKQDRPKAKHKGRAPWYEVLGLLSTASNAEIVKAYRRLASKFHPDKYKEADATERMTEINTARDEVYRLRGIK